MIFPIAQSGHKIFDPAKRMTKNWNILLGGLFFTLLCASNSPSVRAQSSEADPFRTPAAPHARDKSTADEPGLNVTGLPTFSVPHGFYKNGFDLTLTTPSASDSIRYTLDCSDPTTSATALVHISPATVRIDPESTSGNRGKTPGVIVRACILSQNSAVGPTITQTYIFVSKVGLLSPEGVRPAPGWPDPAHPVNSQSMHYGMSPTVLNDSRYKTKMDSALIAIPSFSIVAAFKNLFAADSGIYVNAYQDGQLWERPASIELLRPDGSPGFQINAGLRIRGGASRDGSNPKHAFRFFFKSEYGAAKLEYPLFENEGVSTFDKMDLRTGENYSWSFPGHLGRYNTMISDVFSRDLQGRMGEPYSRSRSYHLYLNGVYWGLYQTEERPEARFAASYFGGSKDDYDVVKPDDGWPASITATDGTLDGFRQVWNVCQAGFKDNANYFKLEGMDASGIRTTKYKHLVDIDNLIDFMLIVFYTGNFDSPISKFGNNNTPRNFFAIYDTNGVDGFKFVAHDAEHILRTTAGEGPGIGLYENRVNIGNLRDSCKMVVPDFTKFNPQWLHFKLSDNSEYRIRFADHVYRFFFNQGWMTSDKAIGLFKARASEIQMAIIAESARWGDTYLNPVATKDNDWQPAVDDIIKNYFPYRTEITLNQLKSADLYPAFNPPDFDNSGTPVISDVLYVGPGYHFGISTSSAETGMIEYTIDTRDPRAIGGGKAASVLEAFHRVDLTVNSTTAIKTRVLRGDQWSALHQITIFVDSSYASVDPAYNGGPNTFILHQNYPNPFNPSTVINYQLPMNSYVTLKVYDLLGREVTMLVNEKKDAGRYSVTWDASASSSGFYFYSLRAGEYRDTKRMLLLK